MNRLGAVAIALWSAAVPSPAAAATVPPPPAPLAAPGPNSYLPPGWTYGAIMTPEGDRLVVPLAPDTQLSEFGVQDDPVARARDRLEQLRIALEEYFAESHPGHAEYPAAQNLADLAALLKLEGVLASDWNPAAVVTAFDLRPYAYRIAVAAGDREVAIQSQPARNPYCSVLVLPHPP